MAIKIALAGNPNCGKTTMFNDLTGSNQYVGNWPGVTVEKKEGRLKGEPDVVIQDLPGIYSLSPYTLEEVIARGYLVSQKPDAILNIVDATNIERNLYLTTQLAELGIPMIIALNMIDITRKNGDKIDLRKLGEALGCEVVETSALRGEGSRQVRRRPRSWRGRRRVSRRMCSPGASSTLWRTSRTSSPIATDRRPCIITTPTAAGTRAASSPTTWPAGMPSSSLSATRR